MAFALTPEPPIVEWLADIDGWIRTSVGFFAGRPVVLDLAAVKLSGSAIGHLISQLESRGVRVMGLEGVEPAHLSPGLPPILKGGRSIPVVPAREAQPAPVAAAPAIEASALVLDSAVRSGQSVMFAGGDVTVIGAIASGAEVIAGGSIHVYGPLRGRAIAGSGGNARGRIFCSSFEAELIAIDGYYQTSEDFDPEFRERPAHICLEGKTIKIVALD